MLTKYLSLLPLMVSVSASVLSSIHEPLRNQQKGFKMNLSISKGDHHEDGFLIQSIRQFGGSHLNKGNGNPKWNKKNGDSNLNKNGDSNWNKNGDPNLNKKNDDGGLKKKQEGSGTLPLAQIEDIYSTELYLGSRGERVKVAIALHSADTWVMGHRVNCQHYRNEEVRSKRDFADFRPKNSSNLEKSNLKKSNLKKSNLIQVKNNSPGLISTVTNRVYKVHGSEQNKTRDPNPFFKTSKRRTNCEFWGTFQFAQSKTFKKLPSNSRFSIKYIDETFAEGIWGSDLAGTSKTMVNLTFGVAQNASRVFGTLGVGLLDQTKMKSQGGDGVGGGGVGGGGEQYANFPMALKNEGYIKRLTYSLLLNGPDSSTGSILFGAVDHRKYLGKLQTVPMISLYKPYEIVEMAIVLDKIYLESSDHQKILILNQPIGAMFQTTIHNQALPKNVVLALVESMSAQYLPGSNVYQVDCAYNTSRGNIVYEFSGIKIKVPVKNLVLESNGLCYLGVMIADPDNYKPIASLGNVFLQQVYFIVDLERKEISMAQAKFSSSEDLMEVQSSIPKARTAQRYLSTSIVDNVIEPTAVAKFKIESDL